MSASRFAVNGFVSISARPGSSWRRGSLRPDMTTIAIFGHETATVCAKSRPSTKPGISISVTSAEMLSSMSSRASSPVAASTTSYPASERISQADRRTRGSSSTNKTFFRESDIWRNDALRLRFRIAWRLLYRQSVWSWRFDRIVGSVWLRFAGHIRASGWLGIVVWLHSQSHRTRRRRSQTIRSLRWFQRTNAEQACRWSTAVTSVNGRGCLKTRVIGGRLEIHFST